MVFASVLLFDWLLIDGCSFPIILARFVILLWHYKMPWLRLQVWWSLLLSLALFRRAKGRTVFRREWLPQTLVAKSWFSPKIRSHSLRAKGNRPRMADYGRKRVRNSEWAELLKQSTCIVSGVFMTFVVVKRTCKMIQNQEQNSVTGHTKNHNNRIQMIEKMILCILI